MTHTPVLTDATEQPQLWLRVHLRKSRIRAYRDIAAVEFIIAEAQRCADAIRETSTEPGAAAWAQDAAKEIERTARDHIERALKPVAERRAIREAALAIDEEVDHARIRARAEKALCGLTGVDVEVTIDGETVHGKAMGVARGPTARIMLDDGRELWLRIAR